MAKTVFVDGNPSLGVLGTIVDAEFLNKIFAHRHDGQDRDGSAPIDFAADTGAANAYSVALAPAITSYTAGLSVSFIAANANTGASTIDINGLGAVAIVNGNGNPLVAGQIPANAVVRVQYDGTSFQLQTDANADASAGVAGAGLNVGATLDAASSTLTITADEFTVKSALGALSRTLPSVNKSIDLTTAGIGGMDTGTSPLSANVAIYLGYNPATGASGLFGQVVTDVAPDVYGGANLPAGYTMSGLISTWMTDGTGKFVKGCQLDRTISPMAITALNTTVSAIQQGTLSLATLIPYNAKHIYGNVRLSLSSSGVKYFELMQVSGGQGEVVFGGEAEANTYGLFTPFGPLPLSPGPSIKWYGNAGGSGTMTVVLYVSGYAF